MTTWSGGLNFFVLDQKMAARILHLSSTVYKPNYWNRYFHINTKKKCKNIQKNRLKWWGGS